MTKVEGQADGPVLLSLGLNQTNLLPPSGQEQFLYQLMPLQFMFVLIFVLIGAITAHQGTLGRWGEGSCDHRATPTTSPWALIRGLVKVLFQRGRYYNKLEVIIIKISNFYPKPCKCDTWLYYTHKHDMKVM